MQKLVVVLISFLSLTWMSCNETGENLPYPAENLPDCIQDITDITPQLMIFSQEVNGSDNYWLNTGANALDGDEYIISESCDTVCYYGGWLNPDCIKDYDSEDWTQVWP